MPKLRLYIEISVWSHWYADDMPERRDATREFFRQCRQQKDHVTLYISGVVIRELGRADREHAMKLLSLVRDHAPDVAEAGSEAEHLAEAYMVHGALPPRRIEDRMHAAIATILGVSGLVTWNFRHLVNLSRRKKINAVNLMFGYSGNIEVLTPQEVFADEGE